MGIHETYRLDRSILSHQAQVAANQKCTIDRETEKLASVHAKIIVPPRKDLDDRPFIHVGISRLGSIW